MSIFEDASVQASRDRNVLANTPIWQGLFRRRSNRKTASSDTSAPAPAPLLAAAGFPIGTGSLASAAAAAPATPAAPVLSAAMLGGPEQTGIDLFGPPLQHLPVQGAPDPKPAAVAGNA